MSEGNELLDVQLPADSKLVLEVSETPTDINFSIDEASREEEQNLTGREYVDQENDSLELHPHHYDTSSHQLHPSHEVHPSHQLGHPSSDPLDLASTSRAGRKRKANSRYVDEPSPEPRRVSKGGGNRRKEGPSSVNAKNIDRPSTVAVAAAVPVQVPAQSSGGSLPPGPSITGPPTFGHAIFGGLRKYSSDLDNVSSDDASFEEALKKLDDEEEDEPMEELHVEMHARGRKKKTPTNLVLDNTASVELPPVSVVPGQPMQGLFEASGWVGPVVYDPAFHPVLVVPAPIDETLSFPNLTETGETCLRKKFLHPYVMSELAGGPLSLVPNAPVSWFRDEIPKLSAYFKKKMGMDGGPAGSTNPMHPVNVTNSSVVPSVNPFVAAPSVKAVKPPGGLSAAELAAEKLQRKKEKEDERKRIIEERNKRRERERLKQLYRQHWLALTKFPIDEHILHSAKGIRRLGAPSAQCRQIAQPAVFWDCLLGSPGTLELPESVVEETTQEIDEVFVVWHFMSSFGRWFSTCWEDNEVDHGLITLPRLVESLFTKRLSPEIARVHWALVEGLRPYLSYTVQTLLSSEQQFEQQLVKNRGRGKLYWRTFSEFRDFLFLCHSILSGQDLCCSNWFFVSVMAAKIIVLLDPVESRRDFLTSVAGSFEEVDFEFKWLFELEVRPASYEALCFSHRIRLIKLLADKLVSLPWMKKMVDLFCDARTHISSEIAQIEKEERKLTQRITLCQRIQAILAAGGGTTVKPDNNVKYEENVLQGEVFQTAETEPSMSPNTLSPPMTDEELKGDILLRDLLVGAKKAANFFADSALGLRVELVGRDRHNNQYFQLPAQRHTVYVRQQAVSHPDVVRYGMYDSLANLEGLIQSLDDRGVWEHALKAELQKIKAAVYQDLVARGDLDFGRTSVDWLGTQKNFGTQKILIETGSVDESRIILAPLAECVAVTQQAMGLIKSVWLGYGDSEGPEPMDDDATVEENSNDDAGEGTRQEQSLSPFLFESEQESFYSALAVFSSAVTLCITKNLFAFSLPGESPSTSSSILVQFHIKSGWDLCRQVGIATSVRECDAGRLTSVLFLQNQLDGLAAIDEVIADEINRLTEAMTGGAQKGTTQSISPTYSVWDLSGGEKHVWKKFISKIVEECDEEESPEPSDAGNIEDEDLSAGLSATGVTKTSNYQCELCGKSFGYHILLGVHKLHPCKTRGRKPFQVEPFMEAGVVGESSGVVAIEKLVLPAFPPPPSSRQQLQTSAEEPIGESAKLAATTTAVSSYICELCGKSFPHNQGLAVHQTRWCIPEQQAQLILNAQNAIGIPEASSGTAVVCENCGKPFPTAQGLAIHLTRWCRGQDDEMKDGMEVTLVKTATTINQGVFLPSVVHVTEPVFRQPSVAEESLVALTGPETEEEGRRIPPGATPAGFSHFATATAFLWYAKKLKTLVERFSEDRKRKELSTGARRRN